MDLSFSQRMGITPEKKPIQLESMDDDLRNGLWNDFLMYFYHDLDSSDIDFRGFSQHDRLYEFLWRNFLKETVDSDDLMLGGAYKYLRKSFLEMPWFRVYEFLEVIVNLNPKHFSFDRGVLIIAFNNTLKKENSAYRFVGLQIAPITNPAEIEEIEDSIDKTEQFVAFKGANTHIKSALNKLSDRQNPDFRNSIKESVSALESVAKKINGGESGELKSALDKLSYKINLHKKLVIGYKTIYDYTSSGDGIRHGLMDEPNLDFEDAKYMLVSCSAFINYLIVKADKAGIKFED